MPCGWSVAIPGVDRC